MRLPVRSTAQIQTTQARNTTRATPDAFGAAVGQGMRGVARGLDQMEARRQQMEEEQAAADARLAYARLNDSLRERMSGDNGYLTQTGRNAIDGYETFEQDVDRLRMEVGAELSPRAREVFDALAQQRRESALNAAARHAARERQTYQQQAHEAYVAARGEQAVSLWPDPDGFGEQLRIGSTDIAIERTRRGEPAELVELAQTEFESRTTLTAITAALDSGAVEQAEALRDRYGDRLTAEHAATVSNLMEQADLTRRRQEGVDEVVSRFGTDQAGALSYIRETFEGEIEDLMVADYKTRRNELIDQQNTSNEAQFNEALNVVQSGTRVDDLPPRLYFALDGEQRDYLRAQQVSGASIIPDETGDEGLSLYLDVMDMGDDRALAEVDLRRARTLMADGEYNRVESRVLAARERRAEPPDVTQARNFGQQINDTLRDTLGMDREKDGEDYNLLYRRAERAVQERERQGQSLTTQERQDIIDDVTAEFVIERGGFLGLGRTTRRIGDAMPDGDVFGIPPEYVDAALAAYRTGERTGRVDFTDAEREQARQLFDAAMAEYRGRGIDRPTPDQIQRGMEYLRAQQEG